MNVGITRVTILRIHELFGLAAGLSTLCAILNLCGVMETAAKLGVGLFFSTIIFVGINMYMMKECYLGLKKHAGMYFRANIVSYLFFSVVSILVSAFVPTKFTAWFFTITLVFRYCLPYGFSSFQSMIIFHAVALISVILVPPLVTKDIGSLKFWETKKSLCSRCNTGKQTFELDRNSAACPYVGCLKRNKCDYFEALKK